MAADPYSAAAMFGFQVINGLQQAELTRQQGEITNMVNEANQEFALNDAFETLASGMTEASRYDGVIKHVLETQKAELAYKGVDASYGSASDIQAESAVQGLVNKTTIKNNAYAASLGLKNDALNIKLQGAFDKSATAQRAASQQASGVMAGVNSAFSAYTGKTDAGGAVAFDQTDYGQYLLNNGERQA